MRCAKERLYKGVQIYTYIYMHAHTHTAARSAFATVPRRHGGFRDSVPRTT